MLITGPASSNETDYQKVIRSQIEAFSKDDMETAFQFASPSIKSIFGNYMRFGQWCAKGTQWYLGKKILHLKKQKVIIL